MSTSKPEARRKPGLCSMRIRLSPYRTEDLSVKHVLGCHGDSWSLYKFSRLITRRTGMILPITSRTGEVVAC